VDRAKILAMIDVGKARGLEIGALMRPIVTRAMGPVEYIDRASTADLRTWYANNDQVDPASIVDVDHVWGSQTLFECVGRQRVYDYVVASHVIEHVPDLIGWLQEIASVLADGGIASFVVPDKRYTFDVLRRTSSSAEIVDAYVRGLRRPDARQIFDHFHNFRAVDATQIHDGLVAPAEMPSPHDPHDLLVTCQHAQKSGEYIDTHCWVFTPESFLDALDLASRIKALPFEIAAVYPTPDYSHEFFVSLRRLPATATPEQQRAAFEASYQPFKVPAPAVSLGLDEMAFRLRAAEIEVQSLRRSTSWRVTAPLRKAASLLRRVRQRLRA